MPERTLRGAAAVVGTGQSKYYKHGKSPDPEFKLALQAVLAACEDAGIDPRDIDGFSSFADDRNDAVRMSTALGIRNLKFAAMQWGGGGGGTAGAMGHAAMAVATGVAECVVVLRGLAQGQFGRFGRTAMSAPKLDGGVPTVSGDLAFSLPYGAISPAQRFALKVRRYMHEHGVGQAPMRAIALAAYHHAQKNPDAVMYGKTLDGERYDESRWIVEPFHLFDCCMENDGSAAVIVVPADKAKDFAQKPAYILGAVTNSDTRYAAPSYNAPHYGSANFSMAAERLYGMAGCRPEDVDTVQVYENFTGGAMLSLAEHGFFAPEQTEEFLTFENLVAPGGRLPLNTSGGHLAECYMHGMGLVIEAVRQIRGTSCNQVANADVAMMIGGPMVTPVSSMILGSEAVL